MKVLQFKSKREQQATESVQNIDRLITLMGKLNGKNSVHVPTRLHLDDYAVTDSANGQVQPVSFDYPQRNSGRHYFGESE